MPSDESDRHSRHSNNRSGSEFAALDRRLLALEIIVRGEDGRNGMKAQLTGLCDRFDAFEKRAIRWIAIGTSLPGVVVAVVVVLRFFGRL